MSGMSSLAEEALASEDEVDGLVDVIELLTPFHYASNLQPVGWVERSDTHRVTTSSLSSFGLLPAASAVYRLRWLV
jgi:hypothetical protein